MERRIDQVFIYILTNRPRGVLYTGLTTNLAERVWNHKNKTVRGFTEKYNTDKLVYYEIHSDIQEAAKRERLLKKWKREWKIGLIERGNPQWHDLFEGVKKKMN